MRPTILAAALLGVVWASSSALAQGDLNISSRVPQTTPATEASSRVANPGPAPVLQGNRPSARMLSESQSARVGSGGPSATPQGGDIRTRNSLKP